MKTATSYYSLELSEHFGDVHFILS